GEVRRRQRSEGSPGRSDRRPDGRRRRPVALRDYELQQARVSVHLRAGHVHGIGDRFSRERRRRPDDAARRAEALPRHPRARHRGRLREGAPALDDGGARRQPAASLDADRLGAPGADGRMTLDLLLDLGLPGLVFLGICVWLIRKAARAARTEADLEGERLQGALAEELRAARTRAEQSQRPGLAAVPTADVDALAGADVRGADPAHLAVVTRERERSGGAGAGVKVLWVRSD